MDESYNVEGKKLGIKEHIIILVAIAEAPNFPMIENPAPLQGTALPL